MALGSLEQVADGSVRFSPVVIVINLTPEQTQTVFRHTGTMVRRLELSKEDLKQLIRFKHWDI